MNNVIERQQQTFGQFFPNMSKKELFNASQDSKPIAELEGQEFQILGLVPEMVLVNRNNAVDSEDSENPFVDDEQVERLRLMVVTNHGFYHSFSQTFNGALKKAIDMFGEGFTAETFIFNSRMKDKKVHYIIKVV